MMTGEGATEPATHAAYRERLVDAHHTATRDFDKAVLVLAGGAFGVSMAFVRDIVPLKATRIDLLMVAWVLLATSLLGILVSHLTSMGAALRGIAQIDSEDEIQVFGGTAALATTCLNVGSAASVVGGYLLLAWFAALNIGGVN